MKVNLNLLAITIAFFIFLPSCEKPTLRENPKDWADTMATITKVEAVDGIYDYTIEYPISESIAVNKEGERINGPISQYGTDTKKPLLNQKIPAQYLKEEPVIFKLLQPIQYEP